MSRPPRRHITIRHHRFIIQVFEQNYGSVPFVGDARRLRAVAVAGGVRTARVLWSVALRAGEMVMEASTLEETPRLLLTIPEAARRLSVGRTTLYVMLQSGELASVAVGRLRRIPIDSLDSLLLSLPTAPSGAADPE